MLKPIEGKYKWDKKHEHEPDWPCHKTDSGWSDSEIRNSPGERSLIGIGERLSKELGFQVEAVHQARIPMYIGKPTKEQKELLESLGEDELKELSDKTRNAMRIDMLLTSKEDSSIPFPIYIEVDGSQHERDGSYKGISQSHLDRCKDFCARVNQNALMIRVKSTSLASKQVEHILKETRRFNRILSSEVQVDERKAVLQEYIDCMCFEFAENPGKAFLEIPESPDIHISKVEEELAQRLNDRWLGKSRGYNSTVVKLWNTWVHQRDDLYGFLKIFKAKAGERGRIFFERKKGKYQYPYRFMSKALSLCGLSR